MKASRWIEAVRILKEHDFSEKEIADFNRMSIGEFRAANNMRHKFLQDHEHYEEYLKHKKGAQPC